MNIQTIRETLKSFIDGRVSVYQWDLDYPDTYYYNVLGANYPANTAIELPVQNLVHIKDGKNGIQTTARFPYRITYIFPSEMAYTDIPWASLEGMLSWLHILSLLQGPDALVEKMEPADLEDSISIARSDEQEGDWLVYLNFAFDITFRTTEFPDLGDLQPPGFYPIDSPPPVEELKVKVNRAKPKFSRQEQTSYTQDTEININSSP
jgi:hypothetical protein